MRRKRERKNQKRKDRTYRGLKPKWNFYKLNGRSSILDYVYEKANFSVSQSSTIKFPRMFSLINNPESTIKSIISIAGAAKYNVDEELLFDQSQIEELDFGAEAIASVLALEAEKYLNCTLSGYLPDNDEIHEIVCAAGLPKLVGFKSKIYYPNFLTFPISKGKVNSRHDKPAAREHITSNFIRYMQKCLHAHGIELNEEGEKFLLGMTIENAERHSSMKYWWIAGYMRKSDKNDFSDCHITIFNFGTTIYESLSKLNEESALYNELKKKSKNIISKSRFSYTWTEEELWTLYALQHGVSRFNDDIEEFGIHGRGTADMIRFFQMLGKSGLNGFEPEMSIVSGRAYIRLDPTYEISEVGTNESESRLRIAFNQENDLSLPPDTCND